MFVIYNNSKKWNVNIFINLHNYLLFTNLCIF